jgi:hypothetical protein
MLKLCFALGIVACTASCGPAGTPAKSPNSDDTEGASEASATKRTSAKQHSETRGWDEVQSTESSGTGASSDSAKRKSRIIVASDPTKHGDSLHFRFLVNGVPISGVFVAPGGQTSTFTIPVGTVHFTIDECEWETQGFELAPDEEMPIACKLTKEGDCCEVAIPVEEASPKKKK